MSGFIYNDTLAAVEPQLHEAIRVVDFILR
jgi:hypothetical protein